MSLPHKADEFVVEELLLVKTNSTHGMTVHGQIQRATLQRRFHFVHGKTGSCQAHIRGNAPQLSQKPWQKNRLRVVVQIEMKSPIRGSRGIVSIAPQRLVEKLQCFPDRRCEFVGQTSRAHSRAVAHKEGVTEERAQSRQGAADGRLALPESPRRAADVTLGENSIEHDQKVKVECCETGGAG